MATESVRIVFDTFEGDWLGTGGRSGNTKFSGHNVHVYENGSLGERPGWEEVTWTGKPAGTDPLKGIAWFKGTSADGELLTAVEDGVNIDLAQWTVVSGAMGGAVDTAVIAESTMPDPPSVWQQSWGNEKLFPMFSDTSQIVGVGSRLYEDFSATSYTANLGSGYASGSLVYRDRAFYWGFDNFPGRIYYSDAADYDAVTEFFDVTPFPDQAGQGVMGAWDVRDALIIARRDGVWLAMFGTNPTDGALREIGRGTVPLHGIAVADLDNSLWFLKPGGTGVAQVTPSGLDVETLDLARPGREVGTETGMPVGPFTQQALRGVADLPGRNLVLPYLPNATGGTHDTVWFLCRINGRWIQESFTLDTNINEVDFAMMGSNTMAMVIRDTTPAYRLFTRSLTLNRPARDTGDSFVNQISNETTPNVSVVLPEIVSPPGTQMRVRQVLVDLDYWQQTTEFDAPTIDIDVRTLGAAVSGTGTQEVSLTTVSISGSSWPDTAASAVAERRRVEATFSTSAYAAANEIQLSNMASVALRQVTVVLDRQPTPRS